MCQVFFPGRFFLSTHTHQLHLAVQERWEENGIGALMVYVDKNIWKKATKIKNIFMFYMLVSH